MKKVLLTIGLSACALALGTHIQAATVDSTTTRGDIQFIPNDDNDESNYLFNPGGGGNKLGTGEEVAPLGEGSAATKGPLRLVHIPAIKFGANKLSTKTQNYYAEYEQVKVVKSHGSTVQPGTDMVVPTFFEVVDLRGGTGGWEVSLKNDGQFKTADGKSFSASLSFDNTTIQTNSNIANNDQFPSVSASELAITTSAAAAVPLAKATQAKEQGYGSWSVRIGDVEKQTTGYGADGTDSTGTTVDTTKKGRNQAVKLTVAGGQIVDTKKIYTTDLTWVLSDNL